MHPSDHRDSRARHSASFAAALAALLVLLVPAPAALAQDGVPPGSGLDQYVESLPGAGGPKAPGPTGARPRGGTPLPGAARRQLGKSRDDALLGRLAQDPSAGAPTARDERAARGSKSRPPKQKGAGSVVSSSLSGGGGSSLVLPLALVLIATAGALAALRRFRRRRRA